MRPDHIALCESAALVGYHTGGMHNLGFTIDVSSAAR
jgi:hypothetical protein